jgi:hypothetical protein
MADRRSSSSTGIRQRLSAATYALGLAIAARLNRGNRVVCPICEGSWRAFLPFGVGGRLRRGALCPGCGSLERDRAAWLHFQSPEERLHSGTRILHVAPERCLEPRLRRLLGPRYVTGDLLRDDVDRKLSIENLPFEDHEFDAIVCNHVLEHVLDDRRALRELHRVLVSGGWALLQVPLVEGLAQTQEDPSVSTARERRRRFGQHDHVRAYGKDYVDRLRDAGFEPELIDVKQRHTGSDIARWGLNPLETLHFCRKG